MITYHNINDHVRVSIDDDENGTIVYQLQSKVFGQWYNKHDIFEYYEVTPKTTQA